MWITTTVIIPDHYRASGEENQTAFENKKLELQAVDGNGLSFSPWTHQDQKVEPTPTIKRTWNTLETATEFINWANANTVWGVSTIEEVTA